MSADGNVNEQLRSVFTETLKIHVPSDDADLIEGGLLDSLALVELLMEIEQRFGVDVPLDTLDIDDFRTVRRIGQVIAASRGGAGT